MYFVFLIFPIGLLAFTYIEYFISKPGDTDELNLLPDLEMGKGKGEKGNRKREEGSGKVDEGGES